MKFAANLMIFLCVYIKQMMLIIAVKNVILG